MTQMRGALYASVNRWVKATHPELYQEILASLGEEDRQLLKNPFTYNQFYDAAPYGRFLDAFQAKAPPGEFERLSTYLAEQDLKGVLLVFSRLLSKEFLLNRMENLWRKFYTDGEIGLIASTDQSAGVRVSGCAFSSAHLLSLEIYMRRLLELSTKQTFRSEHRVLDERACEFWYTRVEV
ncbi:MAG TPA: hypothetical protein PK668_08465 [Myxococcota bacterium]|nr:hypothetical protein [Myxococcota bacterium]HRY92990.1 hypothetical protein [Myxococcota bacterium]HSA19900.1 hypothetical protein [Myxococcota bacterium]